MGDILQEIIANKRVEVARIKELKTIDEFERIICNQTHRMLSMRDSLERSSSGIISEFKRCSPSKGWIKQGSDALEIALDYELSGASVLSILTDTKYFGGCLTDLLSVSSKVQIPILRKDFIIDEIQLYEAIIAGADAILLIASALSTEQCEHLAQKAKELGLEVLLEIHNQKEIEYITASIDMVGVNNRNLVTFVTSLDNSVRLAPLLPNDKLLISESGISNVGDVKMLREHGFRGFLIGENFMRTENPGVALKQFIEGVTK